MTSRLNFLIVRFLFLLSSAISFIPSYGQHSIRDSVLTFPMIGATVAFQVPGGDLSSRFGNNFNVGGVFLMKFKSNYLIGAEANFIFSDHVNENNILDKYKTPDGNIIDGSGKYAIVNLYERGLNLVLKAGKIFPVIGPNKNSGLMATAGIGFLRHKILIDTPENSIPYLEGDYLKGYDRYSTGVSLNEFLGYMNFGNKRLINFYCGFEFTQAFTKNRRELNFDTGQKDDKSRLDLLFGFRFGWVFPIYKRNADREYTN